MPSGAWPASSSGQFFHRVGGKHGRVKVVSPPQLFTHRLGDLFSVMPQIHHHGTATGIQIAAAFRIHDKGPLAFFGHGQAAAQNTVENMFAHAVPPFPESICRICRASSGVATSRPMIRLIWTMRSTNLSLVASSPLR